MKNEGLISIIVPIYNVEEYLEQCIQSIVNQTYRNIEIILVNDGSTDNCLQICNHYLAIDSRIILINKKNGGLSSARNEGIAIAKGKYIGFVDSDDIIHPKMYETLLNNMIEQNADIVECMVKNFSDDLCLKERIEKTSLYMMTGEEALKKQIIGRQRIKPRYAVWSKLFKVQIINDLTFPIGMIHEDHLYDAQAFLRTENYLIVDSELYFHRVRKGSITNVNFSLKDLDKLKLIQQRTLFLSENGYNDLATISQWHYWITLLLFYRQTCDLNLKNIQNQIVFELRNNRKSIIHTQMPLKRKKDFYLFFFSKKIFIEYANIREKLKSYKERKNGRNS